MFHESVAENWAKVFIAFLCVYCLVQIAEYIRDKRNENIVLASRQAINTYVRTGAKTKTFHSLGSPLISTAEKLRSDFVEEERRDAEIKAVENGFQLYCYCPKCKKFDMHHMSGNTSGRECVSCGYLWHVPS